MNYEKIIVELLSRIQILEEQVDILMNQQEKPKDGKMDTRTIKNYIQSLKDDARKNGDSTIILISGNIHKDLGLKNCMPMVCNAMRQCMESNDIVLHTTPKGQSSTIKIEYKL